MLAMGALFLGLMAMPEQAGHHGHVEGDRVVWTMVVSGALEPGERWALATPLPAGTEVDEGSGFRALRGVDGRVEALLPREATSLAQGRLRVPRTPERLDVPLIAGPIPQRVSIEGRDGRFVPDDEVGLQPHVGYRTTGAIDRELRARLDAVCAAQLPEPSHTAMYLDGARALTGRWVAPGPPLTVVLAIGALFTAVVAALVAAQRQLARRAQAERAEAELAAELGGL